MTKRLFFFLITIAAFLTGCSDNDSFSNDASHLLTFSVDTVRLDTLFSTVPSSTIRFSIRNHSGDGIRIKTVRLERGNQSGFRANIDGFFLDPVASDIEIRKGDSIMAFVEITAHENHTPEPSLIEDHLIFTLESGTEQRLNLRTYSWDAVKMTDLMVRRDTVIDTTTPVVVYGKGIQVEKDAKLTIRNTTLYFHDGAGLNVLGQIEVENAILRGDRLDHMFDYLPYDRVSGQWIGVTIHRDATCLMKSSEIRNAYDAVRCDTATVEMHDCVIHNSRGYGLYTACSDVHIDNSQITNCLDDCLFLKGGEAKVDRCTLAQFYPFSANRQAALRFEHADKIPIRLSCTNTLVTGYEDDVVMGEQYKEGTAEYLFENCLLRTPSVDDAVAFKEIVWEKSGDDSNGKMLFLLVDEDNLIYDFRLKPETSVYEKGIGCRLREDTVQEKEK